MPTNEQVGLAAVISRGLHVRLFCPSAATPRHGQGLPFVVVGFEPNCPMLRFVWTATLGVELRSPMQFKRSYQAGAALPLVIHFLR